MNVFAGNSDSIFFYVSYWNKTALPKQFVSTAPLKPLCRISWNFVVMKDILCGCAYLQEILSKFFFWDLRSFWTMKFGQNLIYYRETFCQRDSFETAQQKIGNFVFGKDIPWRCGYMYKFWFILLLFWTIKFSQN